MLSADASAALIDEVDPAGSWARFRVDAMRRRMSLLRDLLQGDVPLSIGLPGEQALRAVLWGVDEPQAQVHYSVRGEGEGSPLLRGLLAEPQLWAAGYLGADKLQWPVYGLNAPALPAAPGLGGDARIVLTAALPSHLYLLPRREGLRLRKGRQGVPRVRLRHPLQPGDELSLPALDIGPGGCAWYKPAAVPGLVPGVLIEDVLLQLDATTQLRTGLLVQHVSVLKQHNGHAARIGCSWQGMSPADEQRLLDWLEAGAGRHDLISLQLD